VPFFVSFSGRALPCRFPHGATSPDDPLPEENGFIRSDQYSFVLQGIPAVVFWGGGSSTNPQMNGVATCGKQRPQSVRGLGVWRLVVPFVQAVG
jgi:hypothetical protein